MNIKENVFLTQYNTFKLESQARYFFELTNVSELPKLLAFAKNKNTIVRFLGGGSNLVLPPKVDALVVKNCLVGFHITNDLDSVATVQCASGENWHSFVMESLNRGYFGLENLALIPGTVGGAPIQNIGAYGVEVRTFISRVLGFDFDSGAELWLKNSECQFEYRNSIFKTLAYKNFFITNVEFTFPKIHSPVVTYGELANSFKGQSPTPKEIANKVIEIRQNKLPDVTVIPNVGSFFKNPVVSAEKLSQLKQTIPNLVSYAQTEGANRGQFKLAAGQLIDLMGYKGIRNGTVGMYHNQALVMVNLGHGRIEDVMSLVGQISIDSFNQFGIRLEVEPIFW